MSLVLSFKKGEGAIIKRNRNKPDIFVYVLDFEGPRNDRTVDFEVNVGDENERFCLHYSDDPLNVDDVKLQPAFIAYKSNKATLRFMIPDEYGVDKICKWPRIY